VAPNSDSSKNREQGSGTEGKGKDAEYDFVVVVDEVVVVR